MCVTERRDRVRRRESRITSTLSLCGESGYRQRPPLRRAPCLRRERASPTHSQEEQSSVETLLACRWHQGIQLNHRFGDTGTFYILGCLRGSKTFRRIGLKTQRAQPLCWNTHGALKNPTAERRQHKKRAARSVRVSSPWLKVRCP